MAANAQTCIDVLRSCVLLRTLEPAVLAEIARVVREVSFRAGATIFSRGDPGDAIYIVRSGRVRISVLTTEGRELSFTHMLAGDAFGEIAVIDRANRSAGATALTDVSLLALSAQSTDRLLERHPALARSIMRVLCARLREVSSHLENVALLPIEARVARFLLDRLPIGSEHGGMPRQKLDLGMSQVEMALLLGASRPKVNAALLALEATGAIHRRGRHVECDAALLARTAHASSS